jgi:metal-dependent amidase/aminoacylase/carboxypeptidase family protein
MAVFQPGEETAEGAQAMIDDGLFKRFPKPDVVLGQHVMVGPSGTVAGRAGAITSAADSLQIRLFGRGAHGSMPQASIDPVVMAAATVMRLQTIVSGLAYWLRSSGSSMPRRQLPALLANLRSRRWITILSTSTTGRPASG